MQPDGHTIAQTARLAVGADWATDVAGWCARFVRQALQKAGVSGDLFGGSAIETAQKFRAAGLSHSLSEVGGVAGLREGDVLFQEYGSKGFGHTGVYVGNGQVAENTWAGEGGKRIVNVANWGQISSVGRVSYPDPYSSYAAGTLPTPYTGATGRPHALPSGSASVDGRAAGVSFTDRAQQALDKINPSKIAGDAAGDALADMTRKGWAAAAPYLSDVALISGAVLLLLVGVWLVAGSGGGGGSEPASVEVEVKTAPVDNRVDNPQPDSVPSRDEKPRRTRKRKAKNV